MRFENTLCMARSFQFEERGSLTRCVLMHESDAVSGASVSLPAQTLADLASNCNGSFVKGLTYSGFGRRLFHKRYLYKPAITNSPDSFSSLYPTVGIEVALMRAR